MSSVVHTTRFISEMMGPRGAFPCTEHGDIKGRSFVSLICILKNNLTCGIGPWGPLMCVYSFAGKAHLRWSACICSGERCKLKVRVGSTPATRTHPVWYLWGFFYVAVYQACYGSLIDVHYVCYAVFLRNKDGMFGTFISERVEDIWSSQVVPSRVHVLYL